MSNPTPRPALRKAEDATVHPAAPRPARAPSRRSSAGAPAPVAAVPAEPEPVAVPADGAAPTPPRSTRSRARKFQGSTSDHLRVPEAETAPAPARRRAAKPKDSGPTAASATGAATAPTASPARPARVAAPDLMSGKTIELEVHVPKKLRKAAKAEAKARGLDLDAVVTELLHGWVTGG